MPYFHVVFTLPHELSALVLQNKRLLYDLLFRTSAATMLEVARDPKHLGADIGLLSVLHTWGQNLQHHPHVHCIVPAGGLTKDRSGWIATSPRFFLPVHVLSRVFRGKFAAGLNCSLIRTSSSSTARSSASLSPMASTVSSISSSVKTGSSTPSLLSADAEHVLHYLARYTHRVAISNHRLVAFHDDRVSFRWKDYAHGGKQKLMTLPADEFLRRFLLHVLPKGLVRIRHFGLFANRRRTAMLALCRSLLGPPLALAPHLSTQQLCPLCSGAMVLVERLTAYQLDLRSTPRSKQLRPSRQLVIPHDSLRFDQRPQPPCSRTQRRPMLVLLPHLANKVPRLPPACTALHHPALSPSRCLPHSSRKTATTPANHPSKSHRHARIHRASGSLQTALS